MARDSVVRIALHGMRWNPASRWWGKGTGGVPMVIDVVAESVDGRHLLVGAVKWSRRADAASIRRELAAKAQRLPILRGRKVHYALWLRRSSSGSVDGTPIIGPEAVLATAEHRI